MTLQFAVVGNPIAHSRSPELHHAFAEKFAIDLNYQRILSENNQFAETVQTFFQQGGSGLNITVPFKEQAFQLCDVLTERAKIAKAVNTLWQQDGKLYGDNTDGIGLVNALQHFQVPLFNANILILGAGGATRGVIYPFAQAGVASITIANRTESRAEQLVNDLSPYVGNVQLLSCGLADLQGDYDVIINATSASLSQDALFIWSDKLSCSFAYEMAYGKPSDFLQQAEQRGIVTADGWSMLVGQAIEAFAIWHDKRPNLSDFLS